MVRFAHISDTHLGYKQYNLPEREQDFYNSFDELIDKIIEERVNFVIHSGDLFEHSRPKVEALIQALLGFKKLHEKGIKTYSIAGNHDIQIRKDFRPIQLLYQDYGVRLLDYERKYDIIKNEDIFIGGLPYHPVYYSEILNEEIQEISKTANNYKKRILVLHQGLDAFLPWDQKHELKITDLPSNFHYYALGHVHRRILQKFGDGILSYPGSSDIWNLHEVEDFKEKGKGFNLVDFDGREPTVQFIRLEKTRHFDKFTIDSDNFEDELNRVKNSTYKIYQKSPSKPIVGLNIIGKMKFDSAYYFSKIRQSIEEYVLTYKIKFSPIVEGVPIETKSSVNFSDILLELLDKNKTNTHFAEEILDLLNERNVTEAIELAQKFYKEKWKDDS